MFRGKPWIDFEILHYMYVFATKTDKTRLEKLASICSSNLESYCIA